MTGAAALPVAAAAFAGVLAFPPPPRTRRTRSPVVRDDRAMLRRWRPILCALGFLGGWWVVTGPLGVVAGSAAAVLGWRVLGRAESPGARRRREELERDLPTAVHLFGACLAAGAATSRALDDVCEALPGAVTDELAVVRRRLALGVGPDEVWRTLAAHPQLHPLGHAMTRALRSGASVHASVETLAVELRARSRAHTDARARSVEVRASAPLGLCFLPAFVLLGVVPMVVGVFASMDLFG